MKHRLPVAILTIILVTTWGSIVGAAGPMPYNLDKAERGFYEPATGPPSPVAVMADAAIGRPLGLVTTVAGAGLFVLTLPFTAPSGSVREAAWGLMGQSGGWAFNRPLGRSDPRYDDRPGIFK